jgi:tetratricopeptide (TPR) repeat protein
MSSTEGRSSVDDLLRLAIAEPGRAERESGEILAAGPGPWEESVARQARGIVLRDRGLLDGGLTELRLALRLARRAGDRDRQADVRATLGVTLVMSGRSDAGLDHLDRAVIDAADPAILARILTRRANIYYFFLDRPHAAVVDLEAALPRLRSAHDRVWEARALNVLGLNYLAVGRTDDATRAVGAAEELFVREGQDVEALVTLHNRGFIAYCSGDLPRALSLYDAAAARYATFHLDRQKLVSDRCDALLAAGLADEAVQLVTARLDKGLLQPVEEAELLLARASAELARQDPQAALASALRARTLFRRQHRDWWADHAELSVLTARYRNGSGGRRLVQDADAVGRRLQLSGSDRAADAWLLAGVAAAARRLESAPELLDRAAGFRSRSSALVRATGWRALAIKRDAVGDSAGVLSACRCGLEALDEHRQSLGSSELRARANRHGDQLANIAMRHAIASRPRVMLAWSERWRATALTQPPVRPPEDDDLARLLASLRDTRRRLGEARAAGTDMATRLDAERTRLELAIRQRTHHLGGSSEQVPRFDVGQLVETLGETSFVELVEVDGRIHALVVAAGRVRHIPLGDAREADALVGVARFALRQVARGRPVDLADLGERLQDALLGDSVRALLGGKVVLSPTTRLHRAPWAMLPCLADVPFSVAPSAALWLRAASTRTPSVRRVLIAGPGLESGGAEIPALAERHPDAIVLRAGSATVERCLEALDGAAVAHVAAHGRFREDSPMFSSLELDDGPMTVHDLERLPRAPHHLVLSACESGVVAPIGAGEMLGLASAMLSMGTAGIVSSVAPVNDAATAVLMLDVHRAIDDGDDLGTVLLRARRSSRGDSVRQATAAAFVAMGA